MHSLVIREFFRQRKIIVFSFYVFFFVKTVIYIKKCLNYFTEFIIKKAEGIFVTVKNQVQVYTI